MWWRIALGLFRFNHGAIWAPFGQGISHGTLSYYFHAFRFFESFGDLGRDLKGRDRALRTRIVSISNKINIISFIF